MALTEKDKVILYVDIYGVNDGSPEETKTIIRSNTDSKFKVVFDKSLRILQNKSTMQLQGITCAICNPNIDSRINSDHYYIDDTKYPLRPNYLSDVDKVCREINETSSNAITLSFDKEIHKVIASSTDTHTVKFGEGLNNILGFRKTLNITAGQSVTASMLPRITAYSEQLYFFSEDIEIGYLNGALTTVLGAADIALFQFGEYVNKLKIDGLPKKLVPSHNNLVKTYMSTQGQLCTNISGLDFTVSDSLARPANFNRGLMILLVIDYASWNT